MAAKRDRRNDRIACTRCGQQKGRNAFEKTPSGRRRVCRSCRGLDNRRSLHNIKARVESASEAPLARACSSCGENKAIEEYGYRADKAYFRSTKCRTCVSLEARAAKYGVSVEWLRKETDRQAGCCPICGRAAHLRVDHDHETGKVRGLICHNCNTGLGHFKDDPDWMMSAVAYLLQSSNLLVKETL